jgi:deoxyribodipyrimidine photolyase-related protein
MTNSATIRLVLGDQLNPRHSWYNQVDPSVVYVLMEVRQETDYVTHHIQKVAAFFAAMRAFAEFLRDGGHRVIYFKLDAADNRHNFLENLLDIIVKEDAAHLEYQLPDEWRLDRELAQLGKSLPVSVTAVDSEHFLTTRDDLARHFKGKKRYLMESFYRAMRKRHAVLMDGDQPVGGRWNFDQDNRNRYDGKVPIPRPKAFDNDVAGIVKMIHRAGVTTIGTCAPEDFTWPVNREQSLSLLDYFVDRLLPGFGTYQDALTTESWSLFHSRLSFSLNAKMIHPMEVIDAAVKRLGGEDVGISQVEGFVRQILGWREFVRGIYWARMPEYEGLNYFQHTGSLPGYYWTGETGMACLRHAITQSLQYAYAHHIQRLMVTGNFALLAGVAPDEVDAWYLGIYIDAVQWVEIVNTRGMSQFADGGLVGTKPYISSAAYIHRMSDYCKACRYDHRKKTEDDACPFNSLYWGFLHRHRKLLGNNPRMGMMYRTLDRMTDANRRAILKKAEGYLARIEEL